MTEVVPFRAHAPRSDQGQQPETAPQSEDRTQMAPQRPVPPVSSRPASLQQLVATLSPEVRAKLAALPPAVQRWLGTLDPEVQEALADLDEPTQLQVVQALSDLVAQQRQRPRLIDRPAGGMPATESKPPPITGPMAREFADFLLGRTGPPVWIAKAKVESPDAADRALVPYDPAQREEGLLGVIGDRRRAGIETELADLRKQRPVGDNSDRETRARNDHLEERVANKMGLPAVAERRRQEQREEFEKLRAGRPQAGPGVEQGGAVGTGAGLASEAVDTGALQAQLSSRHGTISAAMQTVTSQLKRKETQAYLAAARKHPENAAADQVAAFDRAFETNDWLTADRVLTALVSQATAAMAQGKATLLERRSDMENAGPKNLSCHRPPDLRPSRLAVEEDGNALDWVGLGRSVPRYLEQVDLALGARERFRVIEDRIPSITDEQLSANLAKFVAEHKKLTWEKVMSPAVQDKYSLLHLENSLDQYADSQSRKELEAKRKGMNAQTLRALKIYEDMTDQYQRWDGTLKNRGAWWGSKRPGDTAGAQRIDTELLPIIKSWAERAGWQQKESRTAGISFHRGRGGIDFIYHSRASD